MTEYTVGTRVDLSDLNDAPIKPRVTTREHYDQFIAGTKIKFWEVTQEFVIMAVKEPPTPLTRFFA